MERKEFLTKFGGMLILGSLSIAGFAQDSPKENKKYTVITKRCDGCGHCFKACRDKALLADDNGKAYIDDKKCKGCGDCIRFCRRMAIIESESTRT